MYDCLKDAVGLSQMDCECTEDSRPVDYDASLSGYYIDDLEHGVPLVYPSNALECGDTTVWDLLTRARRDGITEFTQLMAQALTTAKQKRFREFSSYIGDEKTTQLIPIASLDTVVGVKLCMHNIKGGVMRVRKLSLIVNTPGNYDVKVYKSSDLTTPINSYTIPVATANKHQVLTLPSELELPLSVDGDPQTYYFLYEPNGAQPRNTLFSCSCGGASYRHWMDFMSSWQGVGAGAFTDIETPTKRKAATYGLRIFANIECDGTNFLCDDHLEFDKPDYGIVIAKAIQLLSINKLLHSILSSSRINLFTRSNPDMLIEKIDVNNQLIKDRIEWIAQNLPDTLTDCYNCRRNQIMGTIRV